MDKDAAAYHKFEIEKFAVHFYGGGKRLINPYKYRAIIILHDSARQVGEFKFHAAYETLPDSDEAFESQPGRPYFVAHFPNEEFSNVYELLKSEQELYVHYWAHSPRLTILSTDYDPIGEEPRNAR